MVKNILKFLSICICMTIIFLTFAIYRDIRINKLFNYLSKPINVGLEEDRINIGQFTTIQHVVNFTATDNYLGAIYIPIKNLRGVKGDVVFQLEDQKSGRIVHENRYDYNYFRNFDNYLFGFPVIEDSKDNKYRVILIFNSSENTIINNVISYEATDLILAKYVFPRKTLVEEPLKLIDIIKERAILAARELDYVKIYSSIFIYSLIVIFVANSNYFRRRSLGFKSLKNLATKIFKPQCSFLFFVFALIAISLIQIFLIFKNIALAERLVEYVWIFLLLAFFWFFVSKMFISFIPKIFSTLNSLWLEILFFFQKKKTSKYIFYVFIFLIVVLSGFSTKYVLGGDDTRLFYSFPKEFLINFALKIASDTSISSIITTAPPAITPFVAMMFVLKRIIGNLNLQNLMYTLNIVGGFLSFSLLVKELIPQKMKYSKIINGMSSLVYVFSIFNVYTIYNSRLIAIYLVSIFPLLVYLFIRSVKNKKPALLFAIATISSLFSLIVLASPWFFAAVIGLLPLIIYKFWSYKSIAVKYLLLLMLLIIVLNFHWLVYLGNSAVVSNSQGIVNSSITSIDFRNENTNGIRMVSELNSIFYPLLNTYHRTIVENFGWSYLPVLSGWSLKILPFNIMFFVIVIMAGLLLKKDSVFRSVYVALAVCFLVSIYFFTVNVTSWGIDVFAWLNNNIPGFVMFRNMYDKFAYILSLSYALLFCVSLEILFDKIKNRKFHIYAIIIISFLILLNLKPYVLGEYARSPIWTTINTFDSIKAFNADFVDLVDYVKHNNAVEKYLIFPLSTGNAFPIQDKYQFNHYYNGVSPLLILTGKNDFSGLLSFGEMSKDVVNYIKNKEYNDLGKTLQKLNVKYIIVNHTINEELKNSFVYSEGLFFLQGDDMLAQLVGGKIKDFGQSYSLYQINEKFSSEKIFLSGNINEVSSNNKLTFKKVNTYLYEVNIKDVKDGDYLIFLDPYLPGWKLINDNGQGLSSQHEVVLGYANGWKLDLSNNIDVNLKLYYKPYDYFWFVNGISLAGYLFCIILFIKAVIKKQI